MKLALITDAGELFEVMTGISEADFATINARAVTCEEIAGEYRRIVANETLSEYEQALVDGM